MDLLGDDFRNFPYCRYASCPLWSSSGSRCLATRPVWTRRTVLPCLWRICQAGFAGSVPRAVFLLSLSGPDALHHGRCGPDQQLRGVGSRSFTSLLWRSGYLHGRDSPVAVHLVVDAPLISFSFPVVAQSHFPWSTVTLRHGGQCPHN